MKRALLVDRLTSGAVRSYCTAVLAILERAFVAASRDDEVIRREVVAFPEGFRFELAVEPDGPALRVRRAPGQDVLSIDRISDGSRPALSIRFKHLRHAFKALTFQEGTAHAFASDRLVVDGDPASAMRIMRIFDRLQALTLPLPIAQRVLKRAPELPLIEKIPANLRLYRRLATGLLERTPT